MAIKIIHDSIPEKTNYQFKNLLGMQFGNLIVTEYAGKNKYGKSAWRCVCLLCNEYRVVNHSDLTYGKSKSCGKHHRTTHGLTKTPEHKTWEGMKARCTNKNLAYYYRYGGRGIKVCEKWSNSFTEFLKDMGTRPSAQHSIDRIDNDKGYCPENCRWATIKEQANNKSTNCNVMFNGKKMTLKQVADINNIHINTLRHRLSKGMSLDLALKKEFPRDYKTRKPVQILYKNKVYEADELSEIIGISRHGIYYRLKVGTLKKHLDV